MSGATPKGDRAERPWAAHEHAHRVFDAHVEELFARVDEGLTTLVRAMRLRVELRRHLDFEERVVLPSCRGRAAEAVENGRRDHRLIRAGLARLEEVAFLRAFERVDARLLRHELVHLERLIHHHDEREEDALYGPLADELDSAKRADLANQLARVPLEGVPAVEALEAIVQHPVVRALAHRYRASLAGEELPELLRAGDLPERIAAALPKLLARDDHVVRRERARASASPRERFASEMLAEVSLRSTLTFVLEGMLLGR